MKRQITCASGNGDRKACLAMASDCMIAEASTCQGVNCDTRICVPQQDDKTCALDINASTTCPRDARIFDNSTVKEISRYKWVYDKLSPHARTLENKAISKADFQKLTVSDRAELCGAMGNDSCEMIFLESEGRAKCQIRIKDCKACEFHEPEVRCIARNKCNVMICL